MKFLFLTLVLCGAVFGESSGLSMTGADDFKILARTGKIVDKTLLIKDLIDRNDLVTLITRPRRWGKSTSVSMIWRFFALEHDVSEGADNRRLFEDRLIAKATTTDPETHQEVSVLNNFQGKCPSIFISFKDVRGDTLDQFQMKLKEAISFEFRRHNYLAKDLESRMDTQTDGRYLREEADSDLKKFKRLAFDDGQNASINDLEGSLKFLTQLLYTYHQKKSVCVFIDEYDAPLHEAFTHKYLDKGTDVIRNLLGAVLKTNTMLERAVLTGILRLAKASLFSGINNLVEDNVFSSSYARHYGFTESDLDKLFGDFHMERGNKEEFQSAYNGYKFYRGQNESTRVEIYNPWSVTGYLKHNGEHDTYWIGTGNTELLDHLIVHPDLQPALATLRDRKSIHVRIPKDVTFTGLTERPATLWSLLVHTGYLTLAKAPVFHMESNEYEVDLVIPNTEILSAYQDFHNKWLQRNDLPRKTSIAHFSSLTAAIASGDSKKVIQWIQSEKESGTPIDFRTSNWLLNPLQLAALSGNIEIFNAVYEQYAELEGSKDSEGMTIGDYALLSGLDMQRIPEPSVFKGAQSNAWESVCWFDSWPLYIVQGGLIWGAGSGLGKLLEKACGFKSIFWGASAASMAAGYYKDFGNWLLRSAIGTTCERYKTFVSVPPEKYSSFAQFGEYIVRNKNSYLSLSKCRSGDTAISHFKKAVTNVKYSEIESLNFTLCQSK